jgi:uncharacterized protein
VEKYLKQFAPFVALVVAAALVVIADPADQGSGSGSGSGDAEVAGRLATRDTPTTPTTAAPLPTDASAEGAGEGVDPFATTSSSGGSSFSSSGSSFSSGSSSSSSGSSFTSGGSTSGSTFTAPSVDTTPTTSAPSADVPSFASPDAPSAPASPGEPTQADFYLFESLASSAVCRSGGDPVTPLALSPAFKQSIFGAEPSFPDRASGLALNKADPEPERYLFRTHSLPANSAVSVTDTAAGNATRILSQRADWERMDGIAFTPGKSLLVGENVKVPTVGDPVATTAKSGLVYELNMTTGVPTVRPLLGAKAHKGMSFDHLGILYSVSATNPGYVYRFVPATANNYGAGTLSALWAGPSGESAWLPLPAADVQVDADAAARAAGATAFAEPQDAEVMIITSPTGAKRSQLFIAETGANRVVTVVLRGTDSTAFSSVYAAPGVNAPKDFAAPADLAIDVTYNLYIAERNGGGAVETSKTAGDDIWVAPANPASAIQSLALGRAASVTDCDAEPSGLHFDSTTSRLFLNLQHRGGDGRDLTMLITTSGGL